MAAALETPAKKIKTCLTEGLEVNNGARPPYPSNETILDQLYHHVGQTPASIALVLPLGEFVDGVRLEVTYAEMWEMIGQTAKEIMMAKGQTGSSWVIVVLPQGLQQVCAVWGILRAGCGYVPIDSETEAPRLRILFKETEPCAAIAVTSAEACAMVAAEYNIALGTFPKGAQHGLVFNDSARNDDQPFPVPTVDGFALLLYSSGSTGTPKGIIYDHKWLMGGSYFVAEDLELTRSSHCLLRCSYVWSVSLYDFFPVNMRGGTLFIPPKGGHMNVQLMAETIAKETIHAVVIQPTLLNLLIDEHNNSSTYPLRSLRHVVSSGEKLFTSTAEAFTSSRGLNAKLWNMYGATEAGCTYFVVSSADADKLNAYSEGVPGGVPQSYVDVFVMTATGDPILPLRPVPTGEVGEICFGGGGQGFLARGYWRQKELTEEKFIQTRQYGRLYRTGDAGRWFNGVLLIVGRLDRQVKVRGVRIQPEEIESRLKRFTDSKGDMPIKACLVAPSKHETVELTAFLETGAGQTVDIKAVFAFLRQEMGRVYVPRHVVHLPDGLPRTASGKPDQNILKQMATEQEENGLQTSASQAFVEDAMEASVTNSILGDPQMKGSCWAWDIDLRNKLWAFAKDHKYKNEQVFPASGYLSLAAEACQSIWPTWELCDLVFSKPLPLVPVRRMRIAATKKEHRASIEITSCPPGGDWVVHCTCTGVYLDAPPLPPLEGAANLRHRGHPNAASSEVREFYAQLADGGFNYGRKFQSLRYVYSSGAVAGGEIERRSQSQFIIDPVDIDACFQLAPLVSTLGFQGAPTAIKRVQLLVPSESIPQGTDRLQVRVQNGASGVDFFVFCAEAAIYVLEGLELKTFESSAPDPLRLVRTRFNMSMSVNTSELPPRVVAVGAGSKHDAEHLAKLLGTSDVCFLGAREKLRLGIARSVAFVVSNDDVRTDVVEACLPALGFELPYSGRVWLVVVGAGQEWQCFGRSWAAKYPELMLSILQVNSIGDSSKAMLDSRAPPHLEDGHFVRLEPSGSDSQVQSEPTHFGGINIAQPVAVLSPETTPLSEGVLQKLRERGANAFLVTAGQPCPAAPYAAIFCAVGRTSAADFDLVCASAHQCLTLCSMDALLPSVHSCQALASAKAAAASLKRAEAGHASWVIYAPPLMEGLWFEPPAPAGFHRCTVASFLAAAGELSAGNAIIGVPEDVPKHWRPIAKALVGVSNVGKSEAELRQFLVSDLAAILSVEADSINESSTLDELGVSSLATLRLSQRLRRFLGRDFSAFALQSNPKVVDLVKLLSTSEKPDGKAHQGKVLCLHGFRTSSVILQQQLFPLASILSRLGYELIVPDGPHRTKGPAQGAEGLDDEDSYGWWLYDGDSHESAPLGLDKSFDYIKALGSVDGVVGFSQGGAMAAQVANALQVKWALLFSPVYVPGRVAQCSCPTLVAFDPNDEVFEETRKLLSELPANTQQATHTQGHRLPTSSDWYRQVEIFLKAHSTAT